MCIEKSLLREMMDIIRKIEQNQYEELRNEGRLNVMSEEDIRRELENYGGRITHATEEEYMTSLDCIELAGNHAYSVHLDFWIDGERSDLTLICDMAMDKDHNVVSSDITDLHVL